MSRTVVVTGATGVLGNLVAKTFAGHGYNLALLDKDQGRLDSLIRDLSLPANRLYAQAIDLLDGPATHASAEAVAGRQLKNNSAVSTRVAMNINQNADSNWEAVCSFVPCSPKKEVAQAPMEASSGP